MKKVVVVIPIYSGRPGRRDEVALRACHRVLGSHAIQFMCPESLDTSAYETLIPTATFRKFEDQHFASLTAYSEFLKTERFYSCFEDFDYMLIYQTDCYVFRDELAHWCGEGYSYIGPPWADCNFIGGHKRAFFRLLPFKKNLFPEVGNGGFSLRKVDQHVRLAKKYRWLRPFFFWLHEDLFWCGVIGGLEPGYRLPAAKIALSFAVEYQPRESVEQLGGKLPFGCHAWDKNAPDFWAQFIGAEGGNPPGR